MESEIRLSFSVFKRLINGTFAISSANRINVSMMPWGVIKRLACDSDDTLSPSCFDECFARLAAADMGAEAFGNFRFTGLDTMATDVDSGARFLTSSEFSISAVLEREEAGEVKVKLNVSLTIWGPAPPHFVDPNEDHWTHPAPEEPCHQ